VGAKVALVRAEQLPGAARETAATEGIRLIGIADRFAWRARLPLVIVTCGVPASGKSTLARALADDARLPHLSSDAVRKGLAGIADTERAPATIYAPEWNRRTYAELGRRAGAAVREHGGAIVDATFRRRSDREAFRAAFVDQAPLVFIECTAPGRILAERAGRRAADPSEISDADVRIVERERTRWAPLDEVDGAAHLVARTDRLVEEVELEVVDLLDQRLGRHAPPT
jgi:hypothetical protein